MHGSGAGTARRSWISAIGRVALRPDLWPTAGRVALSTARLRWWRRPPFLPVPDRAYLRFRIETQYGSDGAPSAADLVTYLDWWRAQRRIRP